MVFQFRQGGWLQCLFSFVNKSKMWNSFSPLWNSISTKKIQIHYSVINKLVPSPPTGQRRKRQTKTARRRLPGDSALRNDRQVSQKSCSLCRRQWSFHEIKWQISPTCTSICAAVMAIRYHRTGSPERSKQVTSDLIYARWIYWWLAR